MDYVMWGIIYLFFMVAMWCFGKWLGEKIRNAKEKKVIEKVEGKWQRSVQDGQDWVKKNV